MLAFLLLIAFASKTDEPWKSFTCPPGTAVHSDTYESECCSLYKFGGTRGCFRDGPFEGYRSYEESKNIKRSLRKKMEYRNNLLHGDYVVYRNSSKKIKMSGVYKYGRPTGSWRIYDSKTDHFYEITYNRAVLTSIKFPSDSISKKMVKIVPAKRFDINSSRIVAKMSPSGAGVDSGDKSEPFVYIPFYSSPVKNEVVGAVIGDTVFIGNELETQVQPNYGSAYDWSVYNVSGTMCLVPILGFEMWIDCPHRSEIIDLYKEVDPWLRKTEILYDSPNGVGDAFESADCKGESEKLHVSITESLLVKGELWVKIKISEECLVKGKPETYWVPFYDKNKIRFEYSESGC